tara:strand:- start:764 stop:1348 length:585 start_codon:yes stop_codon:yes gene_type:complete
MFNGIIYNQGKLTEISKSKNSIVIGIITNLKVSKNEIGSSISCDGTCLTLTKIKRNKLFFFLSRETLNKTSFKNCKIGDSINLEKSLKHGQNISGHYLFGHVDCTGTIKDINIKDKAWFINVKTSSNFKKYLIEKGSIGINGVSLTISKLNKDGFQIVIIPHTLKLTNLNNLKKLHKVNIEFDIMAKYLNKISK